MADNSANNKRIAKNSIFLSIRMVFVLLISLYSTRVLLTALGVDDYGVYNVVCGFVSMFAFLNTSMSNGIQRFFNYEFGKNGNEGAQKVYNTGLIIQVILALGIVATIEPFGIWYIQNKMVIPADRLLAAHWIFQFAMVSFVFNIIQAPYTAAVMAHERMDFYAALSVFDAIIKLAIVIILPYLNGDSLILYGLLWMLISVINWFLYFVYSKKNFVEIKLGYYSNNSLFKSMLVFSGWNMFGTFSGVVREQGLNLIMNMFFGPVVNAARGVAAQINAGLQGFVQNITTPVRPQIVQSYAQKNLGRTMNLTYSISKLSCYFLTMMAIPICVEIDYILGLWLGDNIPEHTSAFAIIVIMCSYQGNLNFAVSTVVHATGKMRNYQFWTSFVKLLSIPMGYILLKQGMMPEFALLTVFVFDWAGHIVALFILRTLIDFSILNYTKKVLVPIVAVIVSSLLVVISVHGIIDNATIRFFVVGFIGVATTSALSYLIGLNKGEKALVKDFVKNLIKKVQRYG